MATHGPLSGRDAVTNLLAGDTFGVIRGGAFKQLDADDLVAAILALEPTLPRWSPWVQITDAEIKAIMTTAKIIVAAPAAGKVHVFHAGLLVSRFFGFYGGYGTSPNRSHIDFEYADSGSSVSSSVPLPWFFDNGEDWLSYTGPETRDPTLSYEVTTQGVHQFILQDSLSDAAGQAIHLKAHNKDGDGLTIPLTGGHASNRLYARVKYSTLTLPW